MISIIVTAYNQEKYIEQCVKSILSQPVDDIEIILVNDGSTDETLDICNQLKENDLRIKVLNKKNGGVSSARNAGLDICIGDYVLFVDGDDFLSSTILQSLISKISENKKEDLFLMNYYTFFNEEIHESDKIHINEYNIENVLSFLICYDSKKINVGSSARACWGKLFKNEVIQKHKIRFQEGVYVAEDLLFVFEYISKIRSIGSIDKFGYNYRIHSQSVMQNYKPHLYDQYLLGYEQLKQLVDGLDKDTYRYVRCSLYYYKWEIYIALCRNEYMKFKENDMSKFDLTEANLWLSCQLLEENAGIIEINLLSRFTKFLHYTYKWMPNTVMKYIMYLFLKITYR